MGEKEEIINAITELNRDMTNQINVLRTQINSLEEKFKTVIEPLPSHNEGENNVQIVRKEPAINPLTEIELPPEPKPCPLKPEGTIPTPTKGKNNPDKLSKLYVTRLRLLSEINDIDYTDKEKEDSRKKLSEIENKIIKIEKEVHPNIPPEKLFKR